MFPGLLYSSHFNNFLDLFFFFLKKKMGGINISLLNSVSNMFIIKLLPDFDKFGQYNSEWNEIINIWPEVQKKHSLNLYQHFEVNSKTK